MSTSAGVQIGSVTRQNICHSLAPSRAAASYRLRGMFCRPARNSMATSFRPTLSTSHCRPSPMACRLARALVSSRVVTVWYTAFWPAMTCAKWRRRANTLSTTRC